MALPTIKSCWSCGHSASVEEVNQSGGVSNYTVGCDNPDILCMGQENGTVFATKREAIEAWNRRYEPNKIPSDSLKMKSEYNQHFSKMQKALIVSIIKNGGFVSLQKIMSDMYGGKERSDNAVRLHVFNTNKVFSDLGIKTTIFSKNYEYQFSHNGLEFVKSMFFESEKGR